MQISNSNFRVGRVPSPSSTEFAEIDVSITFNSQEISYGNCGMQFIVFAVLFDKDANQDLYLPGPGTSYTQLPDRDRDTYIGYFGSRIVTPSSTPANFSFYRAWNFGNQEPGEEEYIAVIYAVPYNNLNGISISPEIKINLG